MSGRKSVASGSPPSNKMLALVIADVFVAHLGGGSSPLAPLVSDADPIALLKVCETPLIDYILEQLLLNGVDTTYVLLNTKTSAAILTHLQTVRSARGKSWTDCREMKVIPVQSTRLLKSMHDCVSEVLHRNLIPSDKSFIWAPLDTLHNISNLKDMYAMHEQRVETIPNYAATMIAHRNVAPLRAALETVISECYSELAAQNLEDNAPTTPRTHLLEAGEFQFPQQHAASLTRSNTDVHRMVVVYGAKSGVVKQLHRCEREEQDVDAEGSEDGTATLDVSLPSVSIEFSKSERLSVRSDLEFHNLVMVGPGGLSLFEFHQHDHHEWLSEILAQAEIKQNSFGIEVAPSNTLCTSIRSVGGYLHANWLVMNRLMHPLTRESNFANQRDHFTVSHSCHTTFLHTEARIAGDARRSSNVVVGSSTMIPANTNVQRSVVGKGVCVGSNTKIEDCVILDGATIGDNCLLQNSVIGQDALVGSGIKVRSYCLIGHGVVLSSPEMPLCLDGVRLERCIATESDALLVGSKGRGRRCSATPASSTVVPLELLFTADAIPSLQEDDQDSPLRSEDQFTQAVSEIVEVAIRSPSRIENTEFELKHLRLSYGKTNGDLAKTVIQLLLKHAIRKGQEAAVVGSSQDHPVAPATEALQVACTLLSQWCKPFFAKFVSLMEDMQQVLVGFCLSIADPSCPLHSKAPKLMEWMYNACSDELYDERGYCIVSGQALLDFDDGVTELMRDDQSTFDDEDRAVLAVGKLCARYVDSVADFLEDG